MSHGGTWVYKATILYRRPDDLSSFDEKYWGVHVPMAAKMRGLSRWTVTRTEPGRDAIAPPYHLVVELCASDRATLLAAFESTEGVAAAEQLRSFCDPDDVVLLFGEEEDAPSRHAGGPGMPSSTGRVNVAVVGLGFGRGFLPIYLEHPDVGSVGICDTNAELVEQVGDELGIDHRFVDLDEVLSDDRYDAVHVASPVSTHVPYSLRILGAGKHCAAAVPVGTALGDLESVIRAEDESGRNYMMMETSVYTREYLLVEELHRDERLGELTFLRGVHIQDLDGFLGYWMGYPPMHYITHALSPLLALTEDRVESVTCLGTGHLPRELQPSYDNPFPTETGLFRPAHHDLAAEITMSFFSFARSYQEGFSVYGQNMGFEWGQLEHELPVIFEFAGRSSAGRGRRPIEGRVQPPDRPELLPASVARFTQPTSYEPAGSAWCGDRQRPPRWLAPSTSRAAHPARSGPCHGRRSP